VNNPGKIKDLWSLIKFRQTFLLLLTGIASYILTRPFSIIPQDLIFCTIALFASISGCTVLNMYFDRDIDALMKRTSWRPLPSGRLTPQEVLAFGSILSLFGILLAFYVMPLFGIIVLTGFAFDLGIYTILLKRLSPFSILWGGISGGMPALAGRALALGSIDLVGVLFALSILLWIPAHILTLAMLRADDYKKAGIPIWPNKYGFSSTRYFIALSSILNAGVFILCAFLLTVTIPFLIVSFLLGIAIVGTTIFCLVQPGSKNDFFLFKAASMYMGLSFALLTIAAYF
jgi:protoheme IX farnesyltransferase